MFLHNSRPGNIKTRLCQLPALWSKKVFLHRLQIVQNSAACVILKMRKYDHISGARQELHWLPIQQRIAFSILTDVYRVLHDLAPTYITDLISLAQPARLTRSSKNFNIAFPVKVPRNSYGKRAFVHAAPTLWNNLPVSICIRQKVIVQHMEWNMPCYKAPQIR